MDRRSFLEIWSGALLASRAKSASVSCPADTLSPAGNAARGARKAVPGKPNILMLMADQFRADCMGAYGNPLIKTPNLDRIAREGVRFTNAYTSVPSCTPARSALLTGMDPWNHGMLGFADMATKPYPVEKASAMNAAGYYTAAVGKNHYYPINNPHGYQHMMTDEHCSYWFHKHKPGEPQSPEVRCDYESWFWSQLPDSDPHATGLGWNDQPARPFAWPEELHPTHWTGNTAERFLQQYERPEPFFLKVSFIRPHSPYDAPERFFAMYRDKKLPKAKAGAWARKYEPRSSSADDLWHGKLSDAEIQESREGYYGNVTFVDDQIGRLLKALEARQMLDDTMIVFFSDHGDMLGDQNMWRKTYAYEQSAHIPMLLRPAASQGLRAVPATIASPVEIRDMLPTFLDAAGAPIPESLDGKSLLSLVRDPHRSWRDYIDLEHNICYDKTNHWNALTDGRWKYIFHAYSGDEQLFNLIDDSDELEDLTQTGSNESVLKEWRGRMVSHLEQRGPQWVQNGTLIQRKEGQMFSPNFPG